MSALTAASVTASSSSSATSISFGQQTTGTPSVKVKTATKLHEKPHPQVTISAEHATRKVNQIIQSATQLAAKKPDLKSGLMRRLYTTALSGAAEELQSMKRRDLSLIEMEYALIRQSSSSTTTMQKVNEVMENVRSSQNEIRSAEKIVKEAIKATEQKPS